MENSLLLASKFLKQSIMKIIKIGIVALVTMLLVANKAKAQQIPLYASYMQNAYLLSPSFAGIMDDEQQAARLLLAHRSQFAGIDGAPTTYVAAIDAPINSNMGLGGTIYTDKYGLIRQTGGVLGYSFAINFEKNSLHFGLGADIGQQSLDLDGASAFDLSDELLNLQSADKVYFNGQFGAHFQRGNFILGVATNQTFGSQLLYKNYTSNTEFEYNLNTHYTAFVSQKFSAIDNVLDLKPMVALRAAQNIALQYDLMLQAIIKNKVFITAGYRSNYAFSAGAGVNLNNNLALSYTYDLMLNEASPFVGDGHEITLGYRFMKTGANVRPKCCDELANIDVNPGVSEEEMRALFNEEVTALRNKMNALEQDNKTAKDDMNKMQREIDSLRNLEPQVKTVEKITIKDNFIVNNIEFETSSAKIRSSSFNELNQIVEYLKENSTKKLIISGHTDNVGNADANLLLSKKRAKSVATYFINKGIDAGRITHEGFGQNNPVASNNSSDGRQRNRRVELKLQ